MDGGYGATVELADERGAPADDAVDVQQPLADAELGSRIVSVLPLTF